MKLDRRRIIRLCRLQYSENCGKSKKKQATLEEKEEMKKTLALILVLILAIGLLSGCGKSAQPAASAGSDTQTQSSAPAAAGKKTMIIGDTTFNAENWEETIDPHRTYNGWPCIRYGVGETLVHYTDNMVLEPWLATGWTSDGDCTWTITLREGVKFSSGRDMDAAAVKQCFEHLLENHDRAPGDTEIVSMEADGQVLTITTTEPNPALMNYLGDPYGCIIDVDASDFETGIAVGLLAGCGGSSNSARHRPLPATKPRALPPPLPRKRP